VDKQGAIRHAEAPALVAEEAVVAVEGVVAGVVGIIN
jgi:hypothetical protein